MRNEQDYEEYLPAHVQNFLQMKSLGTNYFQEFGNPAITYELKETTFDGYTIAFIDPSYTGEVDLNKAFYSYEGRLVPLFKLYSNTFDHLHLSRLILPDYIGDSLVSFVKNLTMEGTIIDRIEFGKDQFANVNITDLAINWFMGTTPLSTTLVCRINTVVFLSPLDFPLDYHPTGYYFDTGRPDVKPKVELIQEEEPVSEIHFLWNGIDKIYYGDYNYSYYDLDTSTLQIIRHTILLKEDTKIVFYLDFDHSRTEKPIQKIRTYGSFIPFVPSTVQEITSELPLFEVMDAHTCSTLNLTILNGYATTSFALILVSPAVFEAWKSSSRIVQKGSKWILSESVENWDQGDPHIIEVQQKG